MTPTLRASLAAVALLTLAGFGLRLYQLNDVPLRADEAFTVMHWMREPLAQTLADIATVDPQPPLAFALYRGWALTVGAEEDTARFLPALLGTLGIPALYALGKRLGGRRLGLPAALLWTLHPYQVWHSQDARIYAVWSTLSLIALWLGLRAAQKRRPADWLVYVAAATAAAYVYYLELFTLVVLNLYVLVTRRRDRQFLLRWLAAQAVIGLMLAPWFLQERLLVASGYGGTTDGFQAERLLTEFAPTLNFGVALPTGLASWLWVFVLLVVGYGLWRMWDGSGRAALLPALQAAIPLLLLAGVSLRLNVFTPRYVLASAPAYTLLVASAVVYGSRAGWRRTFGIALVGAWLALDGYGLYSYFFNYTKAPDWRTLVVYLREHATPDDIIVQASADEALNFYYDELGVTADRKQLPANPQQSAEEIESLLDADLPTHRSFWRVGQAFPDWRNAGIMEDWLRVHMQLVRDTAVGGTRVQQYMDWNVRTAELAPETLATFGSAAELVGAQVLEADETPGALTVWLYWKPLERTDSPLKVSVQLIGATNPATGTPLWSQDDQSPQEGRAETTAWVVGTTLRDVYALPLANVPDGSYDLIVGLYDPATGARAPVNGQDMYALGRVTMGE